jgi:hypothetical protein
MEKTDISTGAKVTEGPVFITAPHGNCIDSRIRFPPAQSTQDAAHHTQA